jgi:hypothetical protein
LWRRFVAARAIPRFSRLKYHPPVVTQRVTPLYIHHDSVDYTKHKTRTHAYFTASSIYNEYRVWVYSTYIAPSAPTIDRSLAGARDRSRARVRARHSSSHRARDDDAFVSDDAKRALRLAAVVVIDDVARGAREPPSAAPNAARGGGERERERRRMGLARTRVCGYVRA